MPPIRPPVAALLQPLIRRADRGEPARQATGLGDLPIAAAEGLARGAFAADRMEKPPCPR